MRWFNGSVSEAIAESRRIRSVFVVYVTGDDEESKKMDSVLESDEISATCSKDCTAIKLHVDSVESKQFSSIYPIICVPCTYFINGRGTPLEVIGGSVPAEQFVEKAIETIQKHRLEFPILNIPESESVLSSLLSQPVPVESETQVQVQIQAENNAPNPNLSERVDRAKMLVERQRKERMAKEKAELERKEIERRKEGQQVTKAQSDRDDRLAKQMAERVKQEKAKEKAAREAIRLKIAQDKAERAAKQEIEKKERLKAAARINPSSNVNDATVSHSDARIQFRLRDGSSITHSFPSDAALETVREFICSKMNFTHGVTFWTTFPRRHLSGDDFPKTLRELGLSPSAALIVDSTSTSPSKDSGNSLGLASMISLLLAPVLALLSFFKVFLFGSPQHHGTAPENTRQTSENTQPSSSSTPNPDVRRRTTESGKSNDTFKKEGKIHSFKQDDADDDENNTWNGNSTQQM